MKKSMFFLSLIATATLFVGCGTLSPEKVAAIHQTIGTVLDVAYSAGGAYAVEQKIDAMAAEGKITQKQALQLKLAAQKSYDALQEKLDSMAIKDVTLETAE